MIGDSLESYRRSVALVAADVGVIAEVKVIIEAKIILKPEIIVEHLEKMPIAHPASDSQKCNQGGSAFCMMRPVRFEFFEMPLLGAGT